MTWNLLRRARDETGTTMAEVLIVCSLLLVVTGPLFLVLETVTRNQNRDQQWGFAIRDGQSGLARMMREVRQTVKIVAATPSTIDILVGSTGGEVHVGYFCNVPQAGTSYNQCVRVQANSLAAALPAPSTGTPVVLRVQNGGVGAYCNSDGSYSSAVFHYSTTATPAASTSCSEAAEHVAAIAPLLVKAAVNLPANGELAGQRGALGHTIALSSAAYMRNLGSGS